MGITYVRSIKINQSISKTLQGSMHAMGSRLAYFVRAVSYKHKILMILTTGDNLLREVEK
jgi:hypothetical protein